MSTRQRFEFWRESPGTFTLAATWAAVYLAMLASQSLGWTPAPDARAFAGLGPLGIGAISEPTGQVFGAWNSAQILSGQIWRAVTATFVHFGLVHIALNVFGLIQLGRLIEEWYGPRLFLGAVVVIGFLGNTLAALARPVVGTPTGMVLQITSGGGSTVVFGLIGLVAVVGKRSRSRMGRYLYNQMIGLLAFNFLIGLTIPQIDNFAHAGGAIAGAILGRYHRTLLNWHDHRPRLCRFVVALAVLAVCVGAGGQYWVAKIETQLRGIESDVERIGRIGVGMDEVKNRYATRAAMGLKVSQVYRQKGRFSLPGGGNFLVPLPDTIIENNRMALSRALDKVSAEVRSVASPGLLTAWTPVLTEARRAVSRPPNANDLQAFSKQLTAFEAVLASEIKSAEARFGTISKKLVLWRTPWPNIAWTEFGPMLKSNVDPRTARPEPRVGPAPNRPARLPATKARVVPGTGTATPKSSDEVAD